MINLNKNQIKIAEKQTSLLKNKPISLFSQQTRIFSVFLL
ncbi:hypothetical protein FORC065_1623 [Yersinia enterocolitica]|nr:hypothetical protein FORC065_1623 [Yersinia enterocolitica]